MSATDLEAVNLGAATEANDSVYNLSGETAHGNDPIQEVHYPTELDPNRAVPPTGYPYLDRLEKIRAEINRAAVEDREPDLEHPGPNAGNPLRSAAQLNNPLNVVQAGQLAFVEPEAVLDIDREELTGLGEIIDPNHMTNKNAPAEPATERAVELAEEHEERDNEQRGDNQPVRPTESVDGSNRDEQRTVDSTSDSSGSGDRSTTKSSGSKGVTDSSKAKKDK